MNTSETVGGWEQALVCAGRIAAAAQPPALCTERHWDYVGIRGVLAIALQALAQQTGCGPEDVPLEELRRHCQQGPGHVRVLAASLVGEDLAYSLDTDPDASVPAPGDPPVATWLWLTRLWPPAPPHDIDGLPPHSSRQRWDGMLRGVARNDPRAAVDLLDSWAADAVAAAV